MNEAIKLAIEKGGYNLFGFADKPNFVWTLDKYHLGYLVTVEFGKRDDWGNKKLQNIYHDFDVRCIFQDPLFWQALGKALGWDEGNLIDPTYALAASKEPTLEMWKHQARKCFDLLLTGGDTDKFWKELLNQ